MYDTQTGMFNAVILTEVNEIHLVSTLFVLQTFLFKRKEENHIFANWSTFGF